MSTTSEVIAVGPFGLFRDLNLLDFPVGHYTRIDGDTEKPARDGDIVVVHVAHANTKNQSEFLAEICNLGAGCIVNPVVRHPFPPAESCIHDPIGDSDDGGQVYCRLKTLASFSGVTMYYLLDY